MNKYSVRYTETVLKQLKKMDYSEAVYIISWINKNIVNCDNPYSRGKALSHNYKGAWRYRIGNYRLIVDIQKKELIILLLSVVHRKDSYK